MYVHYVRLLASAWCASARLQLLRQINFQWTKPSVCVALSVNVKLDILISCGLQYSRKVEVHYFVVSCLIFHKKQNCQKP